MLIKQCDFCGKDIETNRNYKRFCNSKCQGRHYNHKPEIKKKRSVLEKEYRERHPEWKEKHRILAITKYRQKRAEYWKEYGKRPEVRAKIRAKEKFKLHNDKEYAIKDKLRHSLNHDITEYYKIKKIMNSKKYGINWKKIIESLKPFPKDLKKYKIDHIIPLNAFNLTDAELVKKAFALSNLQWLTMQENRKKSGKLLIMNEVHKNKYINIEGE